MILKKKVTEHKMCFDFLYKLYHKNSHSKKNWARCDQKWTQVVMLKYPLISSDFKETWKFLTDFRKMLKYKI